MHAQGVTALRACHTSHGVTTKSFLVALHSGRILALGRRLLDPRRPSEAPKTEQMVALPPMSPFLPAEGVSMVTYNRTVRRR